METSPYQISGSSLPSAGLVGTLQAIQPLMARNRDLTGNQAADSLIWHHHYITKQKQVKIQQRISHSNMQKINRKHPHPHLHKTHNTQLSMITAVSKYFHAKNRPSDISTHTHTPVIVSSRLHTANQERDQLQTVCSSQITSYTVPEVAEAGLSVTIKI